MTATADRVAPHDLAAGAAMERASRLLQASQNPAGWWPDYASAEVIVAAEELLALELLALRTPRATSVAARQIRSGQRTDGSWAGGEPDAAADLSASVLAYLALRLAGDPPDAYHMAAAAGWIRDAGGMHAVGVTARAWLAMFGVIAWASVPVPAADAISLPLRGTRGAGLTSPVTAAALAVLGAVRPARSPPVTLTELQAIGREASPSPGIGAATGLTRRAAARSAAVRRCGRWLADWHLQADAGNGGRPAWPLALVALHALGYPPGHPAMTAGLAKLAGADGPPGSGPGRGLPPVAQTALATEALSAAGLRADHAALLAAGRWLLSQQVPAARTGPVPPGGPRPRGWSFCLDGCARPADTACVVIALSGVDLQAVTGRPESADVMHWLAEAQHRDGSWAGSAAVTAACVRALASQQVRDPSIARAIRRGAVWLLRSQLPVGAWPGRHGGADLLATTEALAALGSAGVLPGKPSVASAAGWLLAEQNADGGWYRGDVAGPRRPGCSDPVGTAQARTPRRAGWSAPSCRTAAGLPRRRRPPIRCWGRERSDRTGPGRRWLVCCCPCVRSADTRRQRLSAATMPVCKASLQSAFSVRPAGRHIINSGRGLNLPVPGPQLERRVHLLHLIPSQGVRMFFTYLVRELRRRARQASIIALGLALGIGLVITVTALSSGVKNAEGEVLHSLYGQDTDITVTKAPTFGSGGPGAFGFRGQFGTKQRPAAGTTIDIDTLSSAGLGTMTDTSLTKVAHLSNVAAAAGGLTLIDTKITGTIPAINSSGGGDFGSSGGGGGGFFNGSLSPTTFSVDGVDLAKNAAGLGPLSLGTLKAGRTLDGSDAKVNVALVDANYAKSNKIAVGSKVTIAKTSFKVVGVVSVPASASSYDYYIPLGRAQALAGMKNDVNTMYVAADSATNIGTVSKAISRAVPGVTVQNSQNVANEITGSVSSASSLANNLGRWLAIAVLAVAFLLACLLTTAAVSRRVREFGTLKALGWTSRRVVRQVMGEALAIGVIGAAVGVGLGYLGSALAGHYYHTVTATLGSATGTATPGGARIFGGGAPGGAGGFPGAGSGTGGSNPANRFRALAGAGSHTATVHLTPQITVTVIVVAVLLAIAGGLLAGAFGGWRAAALRPAAALARVE